MLNASFPHNHRLKSALGAAVVQLELAAIDALGSNLFLAANVQDGNAWNGQALRMIVGDKIGKLTSAPYLPVERGWVAPHFYVQKLLNHLARGTADTTSVLAESRLFAQSLRDEDSIRLFIVNYDASNARTARVYLGDEVTPAGPVTMYRVTGENGMESSNECSGGVQVRDPAVSFTTVTTNLVDLDVPAASLTVYDVALDDSSQVLGVLTDSVTGAPVRVAEVAEPGTGPTLATTDDFGVFRICGLSAGEHTLVVRDTRYVVTPAVVTAGCSPVWVALDAVPRLSGAVKRWNQEQTELLTVVGAPVWAAEPGNRVPLFSTVTDCEGNFTLPVPGGVYDVWSALPNGTGHTHLSNAYVTSQPACIDFIVGPNGSANPCQ